MNQNNPYTHWNLQTDEHDIVWCHLDVHDSSTNILSAEVLDEFGDILDGFVENPPKGVIILSDKANGFIAGANINEFTEIENAGQAMALLHRGHAVFNKLEALPCPTLSLIHGFCLGGGMELALACDYRIVLDDEKARLGLPEILLGIHPGFGGTMRFIRLLGPVQALQLMLQGRAVDARTAKKLGIVDYAVPDRQFLRSATMTILKRPAPARAGRWSALLNTSPLRRLLAAYLRKQVGKKARPEHYPAPYALIDVWERFGDDEAVLLREEVKSVAALATNNASRNLVRVYLLQERLKAIGGDKSFKAKHVHVIGAGVMGGDIAAWCALQGMTVSLQDRQPEFIAPAIRRAYKLFSRKLKHPRLVRNMMDRLSAGTGMESAAQADVVIEAIIENAEAKTDLFKQLEPRLQPHAILATNTSSIALETLNKSLQDPRRLVGIHFFNPVAQMQLVEIINAENTSAEWISRAASFCRQIGRLPLPVKSSPGFLVNRILTPYLLETMQMYEEGIPAELIDKVAVDFGMPVGPVELADTVGLDICLSVARNLSGKIGVAIPARLVELVEGGRLGKKTGNGFYVYKNDKADKKSVRSDPGACQDIQDRLILRILNECAACLREGIVESPDLLDAGMIFGTGFPPFLGGPMHYAKTLGHRVIADRLGALSRRLGERYNADAYWMTETE